MEGLTQCSGVKMGWGTQASDSQTRKKVYTLFSGLILQRKKPKLKRSDGLLKATQLVMALAQVKET